MSEELSKRIIDPDLEKDPSVYTVVLTGRFNTAELLQKVFDQEAIVSVVIDKNTREILIGDTHSNMAPGSRANPNEFSIIYARYDKASKKVLVEDYSDFREGDKTSRELKDIIAQKLQEAIYGN